LGLSKFRKDLGNGLRDLCRVSHALKVESATALTWCGTLEQVRVVLVGVHSAFVERVFDTL
jgi:hypothetical protein